VLGNERRLFPELLVAFESSLRNSAKRVPLLQFTEIVVENLSVTLSRLGTIEPKYNGATLTLEQVPAVVEDLIVTLAFF
jgi:hypothetical protein